MSQPEQCHRRTIRLDGDNYAQQGIYFVTICTQLRELFFDKSEMRKIAEQCWTEIPVHFPFIELDEWILMPNHLHGILCITRSEDQPIYLPDSYFSSISPKKSTLALVTRTYKAAVTTLCRRSGELEFTWQRNYYEHIIRNETDLNRIRRYILDNPSMWDTDSENPKIKRK